MSDEQYIDIAIDISKKAKYRPIDIHTPMWLWSRNGFKELE